MWRLSRTRLRAVIFDLDGTLVDSAISFKKMKTKIIEHLEHGGMTPGLLNDSMLNFEMTATAEEHLRMKGFPEELIRQVLRGISEIMNEVELESLEGATLIEGVPETLRTLKAKGLRLGIMTRSCREYVEGILTKFRLKENFDAVAARDDVEKPKPSPEHALHLLNLLEVKPSEALFVGDHWSDAECAEKAGLGFILVQRQDMNAKAPKDPKVRTVKKIVELAKTIETYELVPTL